MKIKDMETDKLYKCTDKNNDNLMIINNHDGTLVIDNKIITAFPLSIQQILDSEWEEIENSPDKTREKIQRIESYCKSIKESKWSSFPELIKIMNGILNIIDEDK